MSFADRFGRLVVLRFGPPLACGGRHCREGDFDCDYGGSISCDDCCVNGGVMDPRTDRRFRWRGLYQAHMVWLQRAGKKADMVGA